jgi:murein DD-endopeptidase MepM/ murein hydrolase activator NlpD
MLSVVGLESMNSPEALFVERADQDLQSFAYYGEAASAGYEEMPLQSGNMIWPVTDSFVSSHFGYRKSCEDCSSYHQGVDFTPGIGSPIFSVMDGTVLFSGWSGGYGYTTVISHKNGVDTLYAHMLDVPLVFIDEEVSVGTKIGYVGNTGISTAPHLHFEIRLWGRPVDPLPILQQNASYN